MQVNVLEVATSVLAEVSLLPSERFFEVLENCFRNGISMKVFVAGPYEVLYRKFISKETFETSDSSRKSVPELDRRFKIGEHEELKWLDGPGPGYNKETAEKYLKNRYETMTKSIKHTLKRLLRNSEFRSTVRRLRSDGWLDWHILNSVYAAVMNYQPIGASAHLVPLSEFREEKLRQYQRFNMLATLDVLSEHLECRQRTPDFKAIDHFLRHRYNYWSDDIEHTDPFM